MASVNILMAVILGSFKYMFTQTYFTIHRPGMDRVGGKKMQNVFLLLQLPQVLKSWKVDIKFNVRKMWALPNSKYEDYNPIL